MTHPKSMVASLAHHTARLTGCMVAFARCHWKMLLWLLLLLWWAATCEGQMFPAGMALGLALAYGLGTLLTARRRAAVWHAFARLLLCALAGLVLAHLVRWREAQLRAEADMVVQAIGQWQRAHGRFPPDLAVLDSPPERLSHSEPSRYTLQPGQQPLLYRLNDGRPLLRYGSAWLAFDKWVYDFEQGQWRFVPD